VKAAGDGDVASCESVRAEFFTEAKKKNRSTTESEIVKSFSVFLSSIEPKTAQNACE
jgi:hypothetical protein